MEQYIKNEIERYKQIKKLLLIAMDGDHPLHKKIISELTVEDFIKMEKYVREREDEGMALLAYPKN